MTLVVICLDGFRYDYLEKTTFLKKLASQSIHGELSPGFGYASEFLAITGKNNEELGIIANNFVHSNKGIKFFKKFKFFGLSKNSKFRFLLDLMYNSKEFLVGNSQPKSIFNVPLEISDNFSFLLKKNFFLKNSLPFPTIFDVLRERKKKVSGYMWPFIYENNKTRIDLKNLSRNTSNTDDKAFEKSLQLLKKKPDFCYIHFFSTDNLVHKFGVKSEKTLELIKKLDYYAEKISKHADKLLVFSDHGMIDTKETFNVSMLIENSGFSLGKDYLMFLDSTLARFWFYNKEAEKKITYLLKKSGKGEIVHFKNKKIHELFGDLIFQVKPGVQILPNFYEFLPHKANHGYSDKCREEKGFYIFRDLKNKKIRKNIKIEEIFNLVTNSI